MTGAFRWNRLCVGGVVGLLLMLAPAIASASDATTTWTQVAGQPAFTGAPLSGVACTSATHCVAVGRTIISGSSFSRILVGDNGTWTAQTPATVSGQNDSLSSVSCIAADDCIAVGSYQTGGYPLVTYHALIEHWDGTTWSGIPTALVGDTYNFLWGVSCTAGTGTNPNECTAVGDFSNTFSTPHGQQTLVLQGTEGAGGWTFSHVSSPNPGQTNSALEAVRCPTYDSCIGVGNAQTYFQTSGNFSGAIALQGTQSGGVWTWSTLSTDNTGGILTGIDCTSASSCMAVGSQGSPQQSLVETWSGSGPFTAVSSPNPGGYATNFVALSCVSASNCSSVGSTTATQGGLTSPLVMQWDGAQWWQVTAPSSGSNSAQLSSVACDAPTNTCTGVGADGSDALVDTGPGFVAAATGGGPQGGGTPGGGSQGSGNQGGGTPSGGTPPVPAKTTKTSTSPPLTIVSATVDRRLHGVVVELKSRNGTIHGVDVYLYRGRAAVAHVRLSRVTGQGAGVVLSVNGKLPPPGHYTVRTRKNGRLLAAHGVVIASVAPAPRPPRFTG